MHEWHILLTCLKVTYYRLFVKVYTVNMGLPVLKEMCLNGTMVNGLNELISLNNALQNTPYKNNLFLDFSTISNMDYYNGLIFAGYIKGIPQAVLNGGRYDNLLKRMGKASYAIGFGIDMSQISIYTTPTIGTDFDILINYEAGCNFNMLLNKQKEIISQGNTVRLEQEGIRTNLTFKKEYVFTSQNELRST